MKVETFLRMAEVPYEIETWADPRKAPKGKLPAIRHEGKIIADSHFIITYLTDKLSLQVDRHLSAFEVSQGFMINKTLDEFLYWLGVHNRWMDDRVWPEIRDNFFGTLPAPIKFLVSTILRSKVKRNLDGQGIGRHSDEERSRLAGECIQALSDFLGDKPFMMGDKPTSIDANLFSYIANGAFVPFDREFNRICRSKENLLAHSERMRARYFPELDSFKK